MGVKAKERAMVEGPPGELLLVSPVLQVVNKEVAKTVCCSSSAI